MMKTFRFSVILLAICCLAALWPQHATAQGLDSVQVEIVFKNKVEPRIGYNWCTAHAIGSHPDPVGNGKDSDYTYSKPPYSDTPAEWTGLQDDIPGERITYHIGGNSGGDASTSCGEQLAILQAVYEGFEVWAYYSGAPNEPPNACFSHETSDELLTINFDASCSDDEDGDVVGYNWDFGDGTSGSGMSTQHTYEEGGTYEVTLTVRDDDGDDDETGRSVTVEGPDLRYAVSLKRYETESAGKRAQDDDAALQVGDSVLVRIAVENTGDLPLEAIRVPGGEATIEVTSEPEDALVFLSAKRAEIGRLEPGSSDTLAYLYKAAHAVDEATVLVGEVEAEAVNPATDGRSAYSESESTCVLEETDGGKWTGPGGLFVQADENNACARFSVDPAPFVVNSVEDRELDSGIDPEEDGCTTGETIMRDGQPEPECTLRAAMQIAASMTSAATIEFDIPGGGDVHTIVLDGEALPAVSAPLTLSGASQPDGVPIEIDGSGLSGGGGFDLGGDETTVEALAFYGFPGTVLALRGRGSVLTGSYVGSDWAESYTSTDAAITDALRNGGTAVLVTGNGTRIGGVGSEGNLLIGSTTGIEVDGAWDVEILGNAVGILEMPHAEHGIDLSDADRVRIGTPEAPNTINYNLEYGIRLDEATSGALIRNNEIIRSRMDGILIQQGAAGGDPVVIGGEEEGDGNTIERSIGAGIRVTGSGGSAGGDPALLIQGNVLKENEEIGIRLEGGSAVQIGGATGTPGTGAGNDIEDGIELDSGRSSWVQGNRIARLDPETGYSEEGAAVDVGGTNNVIGGETPAEGNVIYGIPKLVEGDEEGTLEEDTASGFGIADEGTQTTIQHNMIGNEGPLLNGVLLRGTLAEVLENTISGNSNVGLVVRSTATIEGNVISGNGTPATDGALWQGAGVVLYTAATLGGEKEDEACERPCNLISDNVGPGILIQPTATGTILQGNVIQGNGESGIIALADNVVIGGENDIELGDCKGPCNIIGANKGDGIRNFKAEVRDNIGPGATKIARTGESGANGFIIEGNIIGAGPLSGIGNEGHGIALGALGSDHRVGGLGIGDGNFISGNGRSGVVVMASTADQFINVQQWLGGKGNQIRGNRILNNGKLAIDLDKDNEVPGGDGWNALGTEDLSYGPNAMLNWPYLVESGEGGAQGSDLLVLWTGPPDAGSSTYSLDVYTNAGCRGAMGEAGNYLVSRDVTFPVGGGTNINAVRVDVPLVGSMPYYAATLTDSEGNTSELSNCRRAGEHPEQALQNVTPDIRTLINRLLITLQEEEAGKSMADVELLVLRFEESTGGDTFEETAALTPEGQPVMLQSTQGAYWEVVAPGAPSALHYDVCLDASDISDAGDALVLGRGAATNGAWRPFDTRLETVDGVDYACADGLSAQHLTLGSGTPAVMATPLLLTPVHNATDVALGTSFTWQPLSEAASYDVQVALDADFTALLHDETGIAGTETTPSDMANNQRHYWRVRGVTNGGEAGPWSVPFRFTSKATSVDVEEEAGVPERFVLEGNYPNPFNPQTTIGFALPQSAQVRLVVYDVLGREVARLVEGVRSAGRHEAVFDAARLPSGVYLYRLEANDFTQTRRMLLIK